MSRGMLACAGAALAAFVVAALLIDTRLTEGARIRLWQTKGVVDIASEGLGEGLGVVGAAWVSARDDGPPSTGAPRSVATCLADAATARGALGTENASRAVVVVAASALARLRATTLRHATGGGDAGTWTLGAVLGPWRAEGYAAVLVDDVGTEGRAFVWDSAGGRDGGGGAARVVSAAEVACLGLGGAGGGAGVLWAIAAGAGAVADVAHLWPLHTAALTLPPNYVTLLPAPTAARGPTLREHFTAALIAGARRARAAAASAGSATGGAPIQRRGGELCVRPALPVLQLGLCHAPADYEWGRHDAAAANWPPEPRDAAAVASVVAVASGGRLLEDVAPLALPAGTVLEAFDAFGVETAAAGEATDAGAAAYAAAHLRFAFPQYNRLAGRAAAWTLLPVLAGTPASVALQLAAAAAGHGVTVLPPGRLCNVSSPARRSDGGGDAPAAPTLSRSLGLDAAPSPPPPMDGTAGVAAAAAALPRIASSAGLPAAAAAALGRWLSLAAQAYAVSAAAVAAAAGGDDGGGAAVSAGAHPAARALAVPYARHCYADHTNVRDGVLVLNFNNYPMHASNVTLNRGPLSLAYLRELYAPYFPLIVATADVSAVGDGGVPEDNLVPCWDCAGRAVAAYPGRQGYAFVQDDAFWMPWNLLANSPHRVWTVTHAHNRSNWWIGCDRKRDNHWCHGCYTTSHMGDARIGDLYPQLTPRQIATKDANTGHVRGVSCDLTDALYVPGRLGAEFRDLALLFAAHHVEVELALTTILDTIALRAETEVLNHVNGPRDPAKLLEDFHDRYDGVRTLGWIHPFKWTWAALRERQLADFATVERDALFTAPNMTWLRPGGRPEVHIGKL